jgi:hypothetical protein
MASTTKYQPAPQEDPEDYTHAPPAYAEGSSSRTDEQTGLFGAPRSSEDNIPDDFKVQHPRRRASACYAAAPALTFLEISFG